MIGFMIGWYSTMTVIASVLTFMTFFAVLTRFASRALLDEDVVQELEFLDPYVHAAFGDPKRFFPEDLAKRNRLEWERTKASQYDPSPSWDSWHLRLKRAQQEEQVSWRAYRDQVWRNNEDAWRKQLHPWMDGTGTVHGSFLGGLVAVPWWVASVDHYGDLLDVPEAVTWAYVKRRESFVTRKDGDPLLLGWRPDDTVTALFVNLIKPPEGHDGSWESWWALRRQGDSWACALSDTFGEAEDRRS